MTGHVLTIFLGVCEWGDISWSIARSIRINYVAAKLRSSYWVSRNLPMRSGNTKTKWITLKQSWRTILSSNDSWRVPHMCKFQRCCAHKA